MNTTIALALVLVVLAVAATSSRRVAVVVSLVAFVGFNFFALPPVGTFAISRRDDVIALFALLAVSLIGSHLSQQARARAEEAVALARERTEADIARRSAEAKSALVASMSHDLKTPLTALTIAAGNLRLPELSDEERREQLDIVQGELARLQRLFDNVVQMASVDTRAMNAELEWVEPSDIVEAARARAGSTLAGRVIEIRDQSERLVRIDPRLTSAALAHVLENAAAYSPALTPITVEVRVPPDTLVLVVRDHGPGLPPADLERVFERFYRGGGTANRFGSGMGLAIAKGLVELQGGRIAAANDPEGGARFTLQIPAATRATSDLALDLA